ncbi:GNAT family N-acetyltransferase [Acetobacteraceae bacterium KSS8]|uniref:GNAT family N-acetyltransferase n=1 Tax=Endosaccharibacter trunci TaxID=2812733 RepID=A0ABT1W750_9PROT|nr:GNAT family N-acetyltransferase [Acetobacteraceae bacterium KSS8]
MGWIEPVTLQGPHATLVPLDPSHHDALVRAASDGALWRHWYTSVPSPETMAAAIVERLALRDSGMMIPFAVVDTASGETVGMTSFGNIDHTFRRVEIGWTWYAQRMQRTALNTDAKRLLLTHAFETLQCIAVELRTHALNLASRRAIERIGARLDGILRHHRRTDDGALRDTCVYSIIAPDWPAVRMHLAWMLERHRE